MGFGDNFWAATGGDGIAKTAKAVGKGDFKGAWEANKNNIADVTTIGLSKGARDKKKAEEEAAARSADNSAKLGVEVDASLKRQGVMNDAYKKARDSGTAAMNASDLDYEDRLKTITEQAERSSRDASTVYNNMSTEYRGMQDKANEQAGQAMSIKDYMDPNNAVAAGTRQLYNQEGATQRGNFNSEAELQHGQYNDEGTYQQGFYDKQASGEGRRGQADFGVLSALGAQSAGQFGSAPMTVGQQMAMMAQSQRQAGEAYAGAQRRVQGLRDQGLQANMMNRDRGLEQSSSLRGRGLDTESGLRTSGIRAGEDRTDAAYAAGESARDRQRGLMNDRQGLESNFRNYEMSSRGEREGFSQNKNASQSGRANRTITTAADNRGIGFQQEAARMAEQMRRNGASESAIQVKLQQAAAEQASYAKAVGTGVSIAGTVGGGMMGGPAGAAAGSKLGGFVPGQEAPAPGDGFSASGNAAKSMDPAMAQPAPYDQSGIPMTQNSGAFGNYLQRKYPSRSTANA